MSDLHAPEAPATHDGHDPDFPIVVRGLRNAFGEHVIHEDLSLEVRSGEILGVVGGSGTGKSVLMRSVIGLQQPAAGEIHVLGRDMMHEETAEDEIDIRSRWGVLFQGGALFSTLTVGENVEVPLKQFYPDMSDSLRQEIARFKVRLSGLPEEAALKYPSELSGGMRKRAGLARALALDPELLFLDEPTAGLDPIGAAAFDQLTRELKETLGLTVFLITHDLDTLYAICDRVAVLADKTVIAVGTIPELLALDHPWIQEYFNGPRGRAAQASEERQQPRREPLAQTAARGLDATDARIKNTGPQGTDIRQSGGA
ncbi:phospholipid/cholesterol/gamma-HCH transport system ATP-binding protein [Novosphingobium chloroacetimidivorans]|uniref:Phospholipid/cholesterol/gamma-HCH transport system ATP-binding protein n=1 Tax=Novosphingobium chloroacetimidivorans TaxID=1428314 RepID=A0A7W7KDS0_9SPHN|nr:ABC transporter ATP-binding protein [Novosphingobium chloroacetimidivorans]MBB4860981.1 phospholipid/cholesterol/gamma-HCH transport system ATP-binding protein [Novosphingobium chloroacetimidivorans]